VIPDVMQHMVYADLSTPLSASHFANASQGAIYGLAATPDRYGCSALRSRTPLRGLHLTGVDPFSLGVVGAMMAGCLTAASLDWRIYRRLI
ncbi:MAG: NAD(P)/FAD-dependent oxidoreductase, partial [Planctomycetota bacterium]|jgi:all-trans-retinol 13,14-reductase|nr:NAD(P)/FAD-dependent oxidoreductase [Planctomycetota bacterium]